MTMQDLKSLILPRLMSGARDGLPLERIGATTPLQALSLAGQAIRFEPPSRPAQLAVEAIVNDGRRILPDPARKLLLRLLAGKGPTSNMPAAAIARTMNARQLRPHPFDLPKLESFAKSHAEALGAEAMAFAQRETPTEQKQNYFAPDQLTDETWMLATPAVKAGFIAGRRARDPAAALALLEASWGTESADSRLRLLATLRADLSERDSSFLTGLSTDRAPRVRELAQRMLARLPGFAGDDPALRAALERMKTAKSGLVFKKLSLALEIPTTVQPHAVSGWVRQTFAGVEFAGLGNALSMSAQEIVDAAQKDAPMRFACFVMATEEKRLDLVETIAGRTGNLWAEIVAAGFDELPGYSPDERARWAELVVQPRSWGETTTLWTLTTMLGLLEGTGSEQLMRDLLASKPWTALSNDPTRLTADIVENLAVLCPSTMRPMLRAQIADIDGNRSNTATLFLDLMDILEAPDA
jgi:hypothetical protein